MTVSVLESGGLVTVQDAGRIGWAHLGVPRGGALDPPAMRLANRLVGNPVEEAVLEVTMGSLRFRVDRAVTFAVTGAQCPIRVDGRARPWGEAVTVVAGAEVHLGHPFAGVRSYVAWSGGLQVSPVLGSRSTDTLAWVGPPPVRTGAELPLGPPGGPPAPFDAPRWVSPPDRLRLAPGPRPEWFEPDVVARLCASAYVVTPLSNRIGLRLAGPSVARRRTGELPSEGMVLGGIQIPPDGQPVVLLNDHPTTGGYPVAAVVLGEDVARCAQLAPGDEVRFTPAAAAV